MESISWLTGQGTDCEECKSAVLYAEVDRSRSCILKNTTCEMEWFISPVALGELEQEEGCNLNMDTAVFELIDPFVVKREL